jgi:hypothetical protein
MVGHASAHTLSEDASWPGSALGSGAPRRNLVESLDDMVDFSSLCRDL